MAQILILDSQTRPSDTEKALAGAIGQRLALDGHIALTHTDRGVSAEVEAAALRAGGHTICVLYDPERLSSPSVSADREGKPTIYRVETATPLIMTALSADCAVLIQDDACVLDDIAGLPCQLAGPLYVSSTYTRVIELIKHDSMLKEFKPFLKTFTTVDELMQLIKSRT